MVGMAGQDGGLQDALLQDALQTYEVQKRELLDGGKDGKFVLIHGAQVGGVFDSREEGLAAGYDSFGNTPFLVREIRERPRTWRARPIHLCSRLE